MINTSAVGWNSFICFRCGEKLRIKDVEFQVLVDYAQEYFSQLPKEEKGQSNGQ